MQMEKYKQRPEIYNQLVALNQSLEKEGYSLFENLDLLLEWNDLPYYCTPYDVIPFATIGCDGIHFGLLTDFGQVEDVNDAFVVCISPMDPDAPIKLVARNMQEFLNLVCTIKDASIISNFQYMSTKDDYKSLFEEIEEDDEYSKRTKFVIQEIRRLIGYEEMTDVYEYVEKIVPTERKKQIILDTKDSLGIALFEQADQIHSVFPLEEDMNINIIELKKFLKTATTESKLAFIRDAQATRQLMDDEQMQIIVMKEMELLGLKDESKRLKNSL